MSLPEIEDVRAWLRQHFDAESIREAAAKLAIDNQKLKRWIQGPGLPLCVIALARAYGHSPLTKLIETGVVTEDEVADATIGPAVRTLPSFEALFERWLEIGKLAEEVEREYALRRDIPEDEARDELADSMIDFDKNPDSWQAPWSAQSGNYKRRIREILYGEEHTVGPRPPLHLAGDREHGHRPEASVLGASLNPAALEAKDNSDAEPE